MRKKFFKSQVLWTIGLFVGMLLSGQSAMAKVGYTALRGTLSGYGDAYGYASLVDGDLNTKWCSSNTHEGYENGWWIVFKTTEAIMPTSYKLVTGDDADFHSERNWKNWKIYGANFSDDNDAQLGANEWVLLDNKENITLDQIPARNKATVKFDMSEINGESFEYFMIFVSECLGGEGASFLMQMMEFAFVEDDEIPAITYTALDGVKSGWGDAYGYASLVDGNNGTKWCCNTSHEGYDNGWWIVFKTNEPVTPFYYTMTTSDDTGQHPERNWKKWKIYGANFGSEEEATRNADGWVLIDEKNNSANDILPTSSYTTKYLLFETPVAEAYSYYRIEIPEILGGDCLQMTEFALGRASDFKDLVTLEYSRLIVNEKKNIQKSLIDSYNEKLMVLKQAADFQTLYELKAELQGMQAEINASITAYTTYVNTVNHVSHLVETYPTSFTSEGIELLKSYLTENVAPGDKFPNGSYPYIMENRVLDTDGILAERIYLEKMQEAAVVKEDAPAFSVTYQSLSGITDYYPYSNLVDGNESTYWWTSDKVANFTKEMGWWTVFKASEPIKPTMYCLVTSNNGSWDNWKSWKIYGANFDSTQVDMFSAEQWMAQKEGWVLLDEKNNIGSDQLSLEEGAHSYFNMSEIITESYQYFKVEVTKNVQGSAIRMSELILGNEATFYQSRDTYYEECAAFDYDVIAYKGFTDRYAEALEELRTTTNFSLVSILYQELLSLQSSITSSKGMYAAYVEKVDEAMLYLGENPSITGPLVDKLKKYLNETLEPCEAYTNGSYLYIMENRNLKNDVLQQELMFITNLLNSIQNNTSIALGGTPDWGAGYGKDALLDGKQGTKWFTDALKTDESVYLIFMQNMPIAPMMYTLQTGDDTANSSGRNWKTWKIYGANFDNPDEAVKDAEGWVLIDQKENIGQETLPAANYAKCYFDLSEENVQAYRYFKLEITEAFDGKAIQMAEMKLGTRDDFTALLDEMKQAAEISEETVAQQSLLDEYAALVESLGNCQKASEMASANARIVELKKDVQASEAAYSAYKKLSDEVMTYLLEHPDMMSDTREVLETYIEGYEEPGDTYPHGSYPYVYENHELDIAALAEEKEFLNTLFKKSIMDGCLVGQDVTRLLNNPNMSEGVNGWDATGFTTSNGMAYVATQGAARMSQTLEGVKNGVYELKVNGLFMIPNNFDACTYGTMLCANANRVPLMLASENAIPVSEAVDTENCYITGEGNPYDQLLEDKGYVPTSVEGVGYAFKGGRYENRILVNVTDGQLTVSIDQQPTGVASNCWTIFDNCSLTYMGSVEEAGEAIATTLDGQLARANTLLSYEPSSGNDFAEYPYYSSKIRSELQAVVDGGSNGYQAVETLSDLFAQQSENKMAYLNYTKALIAMEDIVYNSSTFVFSEEQKTEYSMLCDEIWGKIMEGAYSTEEALAQEDLKNGQAYLFVYGKEPSQVEDIYQIGTTDEMRWFAMYVNSTKQNIKAVLTDDIDLGKFENWTPIGSGKAFSGVFDGQGHTIRNVNISNMSSYAGLFGTISKATVMNFSIEGKISAQGTSNGAIGYAEHSTISNVHSSLTIEASVPGACHTAGVVGDLVEESMIDRCSFSGTLTVGVENNDCFGGVVAFTNTGVITNCANYGTLTFARENTQIGGILGYVSNKNFGGLRNCLGVGAVSSTGDASVLCGALVGWLRSYNEELVSCNYWLTGSAERASGQNEPECNVSATAEELANGAVCYALNEGQNGIIWFQTLGEDATPVLDATHGKVSKNQNGTYTNDENSVKGIASQTENTSIYLLNGIKVDKAQKGMYIQNGKKMLKK